MTVNTLSGMHIKSEPITPPRESTTPSGPHPHQPQQQQLQQPQQQQPVGLRLMGEGMGGGGHLSPIHASPHGGDSSSPVSTHMDGYGDNMPMAKRLRVDQEGWAT
jgi:hypothetical protein